jgi:hypothetical protein
MVLVMRSTMKILRVLLAASIALAPMGAHAQNAQPYFRLNVPIASGGSSTPVTPPGELPTNPPGVTPLSVVVTPAGDSAFVGRPVSFLGAASGGTAPYTYRLHPEIGTIQSLGLNYSGNVVSGTLTAAGTVWFRIIATDANGVTGYSAPTSIVSAAAGVAYQLPSSMVEGTSFSTPAPQTNIPSPTFTMTSTLPGASIDPTTGVISGSIGDIATVAGYSFNVTATNGPISATTTAGFTARAAETALRINEGVLSTGGFVTGTASTNMPSPTWSLVNAPSGVSIDPTTGVISGQMNVPNGNYPFQALATAPNGATSLSNSVTVEVTTRALVMNTTTTSVSALVGEGIGIATSVANPNGSVTYSIEELTGTIASIGLSYNNGNVSGTATAPGNITFRFRAVDSSGAIGVTPVISVNVAAPFVAYAAPTDVVEGRSFTIAAPATNIAGAVYSMTGAGGSINAQTGVITGSFGDLTANETRTFNVTATNGTNTATTTVSITGLPGSVSLAFMNGPFLEGGAVTGMATSNMGAVTWSLSGAPQGVVINPTTGAVSGVPAASGTYSVTAIATMSGGATATSAPVSLVIGNAALDVAMSAPVTNVYRSQNVSIQATATRQTGPVTYALIPMIGNITNLGLSFDTTTGLVSGKTTAAGTARFAVRATDSFGATGTSEVVDVIVNEPGIVYADMPSAVGEGQSFSSGTPAFPLGGGLTWEVSGGNGIENLAINPTSGVITGTIASLDAQVTSTITVTVRIGSDSFTRTLSVQLVPGSAVVTLPNPVVLTGAAITGQATSTIPNVTWTLVNPPAGISINASTGVISGTIGTAGDYTIVARATATGGATATSGAAPLRVNNATFVLNRGAEYYYAWTGQPVTTSVTASGATGQVTYTLIPFTGSIANLGLTFDSATGSVSGTTTTAGSAIFQVRGVDANGAVGQTFAMTIQVTNPSITYAPVGDLVEGGTFSTTAPTTNMTNPTYELVGNTHGAAINPTTGVVTGSIPDLTADAAFSYTVRATSAPAVATTTINVNGRVATASLTLTSPTIAAGTAVTGQASSSMATGTWALVNAPAGLSIGSVDGVLGGTVSTPGTYSFSAVKTASNGATVATNSVTIQVMNANLTVNVSNETIAVFNGQPVTVTTNVPNATGTVNYGYVFLGGTNISALGLTFDATTGTVSGTTNAVGSATFRISATDSLGATGNSQAVTIQSVAANLAYASNGGSAVEGATFSSNAPSTNIPTPTYTIAGAPAWVTINASTGVMSGQVPSLTANQNYSWQVTATNGPISASVTYSLTGVAGTATASLSTPTVVAGNAVTGTLSSDFSATSWTLNGAPAGLSVSGNSIVGSVAAAGTYTFSATGTNNGGASATSNAVTLTVTPASSIALATATPTAGFLGAPYSWTAPVSGVQGTVTFTVTAGSLPPGTNLNASTGTIAGTATLGGLFSFTLQATDSIGSATQSYTIDIAQTGAVTLVSGDPDAGTRVIGTSTNWQFSTNLPNPTWTLVNAPGWMGISSTGLVTGSPWYNTPATNVVARATSGSSVAESEPFSVAAVNPTVTATLVTPSTVRSGAAVTVNAEVDGNGQNRTGMTLQGLPSVINQQPAVNGQPVVFQTTAPTVSSTTNYTLRARTEINPWANQRFDSNAMALQVAPAVSLAAITNQSGTVGTPFSLTPTTGGLLGTATYSLSPTMSCAGLSFSTTTGTISGTPTAACGPITFQMRVTDSFDNTQSAAVSFQLTVASPVPTASQSSFLVQNAAMGAGPAPVVSNFSTAPTYSLRAGVTYATANWGSGTVSTVLPTGMTLNTATGVISGTPTGYASQRTLGPYMMRATNGTQTADTNYFWITVGPQAAADASTLTPTFSTWSTATINQAALTDGSTLTSGFQTNGDSNKNLITTFPQPARINQIRFFVGSATTWNITYCRDGATCTAANQGTNPWVLVAGNGTSTASGWITVTGVDLIVSRLAINFAQTGVQVNEITFSP